MTCALYLNNGYVLFFKKRITNRDYTWSFTEKVCKRLSVFLNVDRLKSNVEKKKYHENLAPKTPLYYINVVCRATLSVEG